MVSVSDIPSEIWLEIAKYMSPREIRRNSQLCETFMKLSIEPANSRLFLPTGTAPYQYGVGLYDKPNCDWRERASCIVKNLQEQIKSGKAPQTKSIVFYSQPFINGPPLRIKIMSRLQQWLGTRKLPDLYPQFPSVTSLTFLHNPGPSYIGPTSYQYLNISTLWSNFSSTLTELNMTVVYVRSLGEIVPDGLAVLPNLEVMRFWVERYDPVIPVHRYFENISTLFTNLKLRMLDIRLAVLYRSTYFGPIRTVPVILPDPAAHIFPCIQHFSMEMYCIPEDRSLCPTDVGRIATFIHAHAGSLRSIELRNIEEAVENLLLRSSTHPLDHWRLALSFKRHHRIYPERSVHSPSSSSFLSNIISLDLTGYIATYTPSYIASMHPHLMHLAVHGKNEVRTQAWFEMHATIFPQLISFCVCYQDGHFLANEQKMERGDGSPLLQWQLKDLTLCPSSSAEREIRRVHWEHMRIVAKAIPSVESFLGRGDMVEAREEWELRWPWKRNIYFDHALGRIETKRAAW